MKRSVIITLLITSILAFLFRLVTEKDPSSFIGVGWIVGIGIIASILLEIKIKRSVKIILLITSILTSLGAVWAVEAQELYGLKFTVLVIGVGVGILSTLVEKRSKILFYSSAAIIMVGWGIIGVYQGYMHPAQIDQRYVVTDLESFYAVFMGYFFHNTFSAFIYLLSGPSIISPYLLLSLNIVGYFFEFVASHVASYGYKGVILILGWLNWYPELLAFFLAVMAGIRVALESFQAFIHIRRDGFFNSLRKIRNAMVHEIVNTMPKVVALLLIAAVLETLWTQYWANYWLQHIL